jgi:ankyrin repeat protein
MSRKLRRFIKIDRYLLETKSEDFIIVHTKEEFNEKCSQMKNVHYIIQDQSNPNHLLWQKSNGPISTLKKYVIMNKECEELIDEEEIFHENHEKVLIISAEPGMGKSLILDNFAQNSSAENFFVKIILNTCKKTLSNTNFKENLPKDLIEFVLESLLNKTNEQEISLLKQLAKDEKLTIMFDGLDEVNDYIENVIHLIDALNKDNRIKKIVITTRNQLREEMENHFKTFSFNLNNFDDEDQKNFLHKYWRNLNLQHKETRATSAVLKQSAEDLITRIKSISSQDPNDLIGIPLQTKMLADIYFGKVKHKEEFSKLILTNIADLYNQFIESKIEIQFERTNNNIKIADLSDQFKEYFEDSKRKFYSDHIKLSSLILFEQKNQNDIGLELDEILEYGVIVAFTNKTPTFLNQSFAEFFLAKSSLQKIKEQKRINDKELEQILKDKRHFLIRKFLNHLTVSYEIQEKNKNDEKEDFNLEIENCCGENLVFLLKYLIDDQGAQLETKNEFLIIASQNGHKDIVAFLLEKGIDINQTDKDGRTALIWASGKGHEEIVKMLLEKKNIEINQKDNNDGNTALMWATGEGHKEIVKILLENENIEINQKDKEGNTALIWASFKGYMEIVKMLIQHKNTEINKKHENGWTILMLASIKGQGEIVKMLLDKENIEINQKNKEGLTALMYASIKGREEIVKMLLEKESIEINQKDDFRKTALMYASERGHEEIVKMLLEKENLEINQKDKEGKTALMWASERGHVEIVKMLLEKQNIEINRKDNKEGKTALICASEHGCGEIVKMLLEKENIEINQKDNKYGYTALMYASEIGYGCGEIVKMLLEKENIEINQTNKLEKNALLCASTFGHAEIEKILLEKENIEINQQDICGKTALMYESERGQGEIVKMLLAKGNIEINQKDDRGKTALMFASERGQGEIVKMLLANGNIEINQKDDFGKTALMFASERGQGEIVKMLLAKGNIEINQKDDRGKTALMFASEAGHKEIVKMLEAKVKETHD